MTVTTDAEAELAEAVDEIFQEGRLALPADITLDGCQAIAERLHRLEGNLQWWWGDLFVRLEQWGEEGNQIISPDWAEVLEQHRNWRWVASTYPPHDRIIDDPVITWTHHRIACALDTHRQRMDALAYAAAEGLATRDFDRHVRNLKGADTADDDGELASPGTVGWDLLISVPSGWAAEDDHLEVIAGKVLNYAKAQLHKGGLEDGQYTLTGRNR